MPNFSYSGPVAELFPTVIAQAREAEDAGFDAAFVMDHFYQLPGIGTPDQPMLEAYSALSGLATATSRIQLSALVTGNTYRNPTLTAKAVTTLDVISGGRAVLGIGAGWFELEHRQLGFEFGTFTERFEKLDEALQIIEPMLRGSARRSTASGTTPRTPSTSRASATTCRSCSAGAARRRRSRWPPASPSTSTSSATRRSCPASWTRSRSGATRRIGTGPRWRRASWRSP